MLTKKLASLLLLLFITQINHAYGACGIGSFRTNRSLVNVKLGLIADKVVSAVTRANKNQLRHCVEQYVQRKLDSTRGSAQASFKVSNKSRPQSVAVRMSIQDSYLGSCIAGKIRRWRFPGLKERKETYVINFSFEHKRPTSPQKSISSMSFKESVQNKGTEKSSGGVGLSSVGCGKPVIYLYPEKTQDVQVQLRLEDMKLHTTYPTIDLSFDGWNVTVDPSGHLIDKRDGREYDYLFWDAIQTRPITYSRDKGFVVEGAKTAEFFQEILPRMGLIAKEYNEFIVYWLPKMIQNKYNFITFLGSEYTDRAKLTTTPPYESSLRVYMAYEPLDHFIKVEPQTFKPFIRKGFTLVEWGGQVKEF